MNLKEAFRQQNLINQHLNTAYAYLGNRSYYTKVTTTTMYSKVDSEHPDEVTTNELDDVIYKNFDKLISFIGVLLKERKQLNMAIQKAKDNMDYNLDVAITNNKARQRYMAALSNLVTLRESKRLLQNGATGYKFNINNEQVAFRCDVETKTEPNFDAKDVRAKIKYIQEDCEAASANIDSAIINTQVNYEPTFNMLDSFMNLFEDFVSTED